MDHGETHWVRPMVKVVVQGVLYTNPLGGFLSYACRGNNFAISKQIDFNIEVDMGLFEANPHSHLLPNVMEIFNCVLIDKIGPIILFKRGAIMKSLYTNLFPVVDI